MRRRLTRSFDRFVEARAYADAEVARMLRELEVDIAIDLKGHTTDARLGILAFRPAPIQVGYLGFPQGVGASIASGWRSPGRALVVEPHEGDHVLDVLLCFDPSRCRALLAGKDRVLGDPSLFAQFQPQALRKAEVGGVVAVEMADRATTDGERELPATARAGLDSGPRGDYFRDPPACCLRALGHLCLLAVELTRAPHYKFK